MSIGSFFENLWDDVFGALKSDEAVAKAFFTAAITDAADQLKTQGLKIISDAVQAAETTGGTGEQKFAAAFAKVTTDLAAAGIEVAEHVINAGIEAAVSQLNASHTAQAATTATAS